MIFNGSDFSRTSYRNHHIANVSFHTYYFSESRYNQKHVSRMLYLAVFCDYSNRPLVQLSGYIRKRTTYRNHLLSIAPLLRQQTSRPYHTNTIITVPRNLPSVVFTKRIVVVRSCRGFQEITSLTMIHVCCTVTDCTIAHVQYKYTFISSVFMNLLLRTLVVQFLPGLLS